jgi:hypothetical protein
VVSAQDQQEEIRQGLSSHRGSTDATDSIHKYLHRLMCKV